MTDHYARLHDQTVRRHWEQARKVNIAGQQVTLDPGGPLADAAWAKDRLARARSAGYARRTSGDASSSPSRTANSGQKGSTAKRHYRLPRSRPSQERLAPATDLSCSPSCSGCRRRCPQGSCALLVRMAASENQHHERVQGDRSARREQADRTEQRIMKAAATGALVDLRTGTPELDDPTKGATLERCPHRSGRGAGRAADRCAGTERRATTGSEAARSTDHRRARLGSHHTGQPAAAAGLLLRAAANLREAQAQAVRLPGCHLPGLAADQLETRGDLELTDGFNADQVNLIGVHIGGGLNFNGATLNNPAGAALDGSGLIVDQSMSCSDGFTANGVIRRIGAKIGGPLAFTGAELSNPDGRALNAQGMTVGYGLFLGSAINHSGQFIARGGVRLIGAHIDGFVSCWDATLYNPGGIALHALGLIVRESLRFDDECTTAVGEVHLSSARIGTLLTFDGATLTNPGGAALTGERLVVGQSMRCREGFTAHGTINLTGAQIEGVLDFTGAVLDMRFHDLHHSAATLLLEPRHPPEGGQRDARAQPDRLTLDLYSHVTATMQQQEVRALDDLFGDQL